MSLFPETLTDRYQRFKHRIFVPNADQYEELAAYGQSPDIMIISCCDSRVDPETIFSAKPGELFVARNVANLVPPYETGGKFHGVSAGIEFAIVGLRVKHLVIMGHSGCGGIRAAFEGSAPETEAKFISRWMSMLDEARSSVLDEHHKKPQAEQIKALELEGIRNSIRNLRTFPFVQKLEDSGKIALHGAYFDISSGTLSALNHQTNKFVAL